MSSVRFRKLLRGKEDTARLYEPASVTADTTPTFRWTPVSWAATYDLQVSANADFSSPVIDEDAIAATEYTPGDALDTSLNYYARVRGVNAAGVAGAWSTTLTFSYVWYLAANVAPTAAYQPIGAASLAASYVNLINPGVNDCSLGVAPGWYTNVGWVFNGTDQYLKTGVIFEDDHTVIIGIRAIPNDMNGVIIGGQAVNGMFIQPYYQSKVGWQNNSYVQVAPQVTIHSVLAIAGSIAYRDGVEDATGLTGTTNTTQETYIGARNANGTVGIHRAGEVYACAFYPTTLAQPQVAAITTRMKALLTQYAHKPLRGVINQSASIGNVLDFERDQAWSCGFTYQKDAAVTGTGMIFCNVPYPSAGGEYPGYEIFADANNIYVRLIHDVTANNDLQVRTTAGGLGDGAVHRVWVTYDGSSTAAGVKIYIDGVDKALTVIRDALTDSIKATGQNWIIGNQAGFLDTLYLRGRLENLVLDTVVRDATYVAANSSPYVEPAPDAGVRQLLLKFNEGSGLTADDASGNNYDATLSSATMWYPNT